MKYEEFVRQAGQFPLLDSSSLKHFKGDWRTLANLMTRWVKQGKLIKLRRGLYCLPPERSNVYLPEPMAAQSIYFPSYLSLESALSRYDLIPEKVTAWTSVTTKKTMRFSNPLGRFAYAHIAPKKFFGYNRVQENEWSYLMAWPEKALLDWIYFDARKVRKPTDYIEILRLQNMDIFSKKRLLESARRFDSVKIYNAARAIVRGI